MSQFSIPESIKMYAHNLPLRTAVDSLVEKLDGENMPETDWQEARQYNQALLMAAQVRADYVDILFSLWEVTFGESGADGLGEPYFEWEETPSNVWEEGELSKSYYRAGSPDDGGESDTLFVSFEGQMVRLEVYRYVDDETPIPFPKDASIPDWEMVCKADEGFARTKPIPLKSFVDEPEASIKKLQAAANLMINYLVES